MESTVTNLPYLTSAEKGDLWEIRGLQGSGSNLRLKVRGASLGQVASLPVIPRLLRCPGAQVQNTWRSSHDLRRRQAVF